MNNFSDLNDLKKIHENLGKKSFTFEYSGPMKIILNMEWAVKS